MEYAIGLDGVAIVLAVEAEFGIVIDDADAVNLTTPRRLADYVFERLHSRPEGSGCRENCIENSSDLGSRCFSQTGFYRLRAILVSRFGVWRSEVLPESPYKIFYAAMSGSSGPNLGKQLARPVCLDLSVAHVSATLRSGVRYWLARHMLFFFCMACLLWQ